MPLTEEQVRLIFGLKLRQIRNEKDLSLFGLSKKTGLSKSYLNEIEKGKKYPKPDKVVAIAEALDTPYDEMVSMKLTGKMAPLSDIIMSGILKEIPLELFGIEEGNLIDIIANAPEKVTAFISTLFEIARNYDVTRENFYLAALRSYQESHENYFADIETEVKKCVKRYQLDISKKLVSSELEEVLVEEFGYTIDYDKLNSTSYPDEIRSLFIPKSKTLLIAKSNSETQRVFILAKELGYSHMQIMQRPLTFTWIKFESFEDVLNNFRASYFAGALMLPEDRLVADLKTFFQADKWQEKAFLQLMFSYTDSAETFFQRLTNILPKHFGLRQLFFLRFEFTRGSKLLSLSKEMHLSRSHQPHAIHNQEHYCRRWVSTEILLQHDNYFVQDDIHVGIQQSQYHDTDEEYLILAASNSDPLNAKQMRSVCIGIELSPRQKRRIGFLEDKNINERIVGVTCERCAVADCEVRAVQPKILNKQKRNAEIEEKVYELINSGHY
jgi:predicted transcriptional regulator/DNA-binding XRE family transcriptional regulator